jgi:hypothetical protein
LKQLVNHKLAYTVSMLISNLRNRETNDNKRPFKCPNYAVQHMILHCAVHNFVNRSPIDRQLDCGRAEAAMNVHYAAQLRTTRVLLKSGHANIFKCRSAAIGSERDLSRCRTSKLKKLLLPRSFTRASLVSAKQAKTVTKENNEVMNMLLTRNAVDVSRRFEVDMERLEARPVAST